MGRAPIALLFAAGIASGAAPPSVVLTYRASTGCPSSEEFRALVAARLGFDPFAQEAPVRATVELIAKGQGHLSLSDASGKTTGARTLTATPGDCRSLASSLALALAIAIDPTLLARAAAPPAQAPAPPPEPDPVTTQQPPPPGEPIAPAKPEPAPAPAPPPKAPSRGPAIELGLGPAVAVGLLPSVSPGATVEIFVRWPRFSVGVVAASLFSAPQPYLSGTVTAFAFRASAQACGHLAFAGLCARAGGGLMRAEGEGFVNPTRGTSPLLSVGAQLRAQWNPVAQLTVGASLAADIALVRAGVTVGSTELWRAWPVALEAAGLVGWRFP